MRYDTAFSVVIASMVIISSLDISMELKPLANKARISNQSSNLKEWNVGATSQPLALMRAFTSPIIPRSFRRMLGVGCLIKEKK